MHHWGGGVWSRSNNYCDGWNTHGGPYEPREGLRLQVTCPYTTLDILLGFLYKFSPPFELESVREAKTQWERELRVLRKLGKRFPVKRRLQETLVILHTFNFRPRWS